jgi:hypothetical protein
MPPCTKKLSPSSYVLSDTRAIQKVTSSELLTKQTTRKKMLYTKNTYILNLLLSVVTARIEALVILGNQFLYACAKEVCHLWSQPRFDTFCSEWHYAVFLVFRNTRLTLLWSRVAWIPHQHSFSVPENSCHQLSGRHLFKLFWLVWWMCVPPLLWMLFGFSIHNWNPGLTSCYVYYVIEKSLPSLWYRSKKSKLKPFFAFCVHPWAFLEPTFLCKTCDNLVENSVWNLGKFTQEFWNCVAPSSTNFLVNKDHHSLQMANHFTLYCEHLFIHLWTFYTIVLQFLRSLHFGHKPRIIQDGFPQHSCF